MASGQDSCALETDESQLNDKQAAGGTRAACPKRKSCPERSRMGRI